MIGSLADGFALAISVPTLLAILAGSLIGVFVGVLPGLGSALGLAMMLPVTYAMEPAAALGLLVSVYATSIYGGSVSAILINVPGTPQSAATTLDGYPMAQKGQSGLALGYATIASVVGGMISLVILVLLAPQLVKVSLLFGPIETFALLVFAMITIAWVSDGSMLKGILAALIGIVLGQVGTDEMTGLTRFDFGNLELTGGFALVPLLIGLFAISEALILATAPKVDPGTKTSGRGFKIPPWSEWRLRLSTLLRASGIGSFVGVLPGAGATAAAFIAYADARRRSPRAAHFGKGEPEGVIASEAANNAVSGGAMVPMLALGIPGDGVTAIMLGALTIHGIIPGIPLFRDQPDLVTGIFIMFFMANIMILFVGALGASMFARLLRAPMSLLMPVVVLLSFTGSWAARGSPFDLVVALVAGICGYFLRIAGFPLSPIIIGFILGRPLETALRQSLIMTDGQPAAFLASPIAAGLLLLTAALILQPIVFRGRARFGKQP